ncbi:MAG: TraR/DksA family transcriptional regulator [Bdellovibrionales bacterium]|nr:TraR/DksA family transcriptional regulator [Bdellovibrionales bacterium]
MPNKDVIEKCKSKLLSAKEDLLSLRRSTAAEITQPDSGGDEADQSIRCINEVRTVELNERIRMQIYEIDLALHRIIEGTYGFCEETGEPIEIERLLAIPWTRLSIEGAELRENISKRYARG